MTRAPLPWRLLSAALGVVETAAMLAVGAVIVVRALAHGARPAEDLDDNRDPKPGAWSGVVVAGGTTDCPHTQLHPDPDRPGHDHCEDCGETDFPATPEAAGACPACGEYGDCKCAPARPRPHLADWVVLPGGRTVGMSPLGDPLTGGEA